MNYISKSQVSVAQVSGESHFTKEKEVVRYKTINLFLYGIGESNSYLKNENLLS